MACDGQCVDGTNDPNNCGACRTVCSAAESCMGGSCAGDCQADCDLQVETCVEQQCLCRPELTRCAGSCVDLDANPDHCGECDMSCGSDVCDEGKCESSCDGEKVECSGGCIDVEENPLHCGACDQKCDPDELCITGVCRDFVPADCDEDEDCGGGQACCSMEDGEGKICVEGDECP